MLPPDLTIRWAKPADAGAIAALELRSSRLEKRSAPIANGELQLAVIWERRLKEAPAENITMLAVRRAHPDDDEEILGFLGFTGSIVEGRIRALYVDPLCVRCGIGRLLMDTAQQVVKLQGGNKLEVMVEMRNYGAQDFYRTLHFSARGVQSAHLIVMTKEF